MALQLVEIHYASYFFRGVPSVYLKSSIKLIHNRP
jgi:hypothetical protein